MRLWPCEKSNAGSPDVERCKHVKSQATTVYFKLGTLRRVSTYVQHVWGIIGHVTAEARNTVGTDGAPPHQVLKNGITVPHLEFSGAIKHSNEFNNI